MAHPVATGATDYRGRGLREGGAVHLLNEADEVISPVSSNDIVEATESSTQRQDLTNALLEALVE